MAGMIKRIREKVASTIAGVRISATASNNSRFQQYPVIWLRTPKCASSSIHFALEHSGRLLDFIGNRDTIKPEDLTPDILQSKILCIGAARKDWFIETYPEIWEQSFKWAVVRNPYARVISAWKYLDATRDRSLDDVLGNLPDEGDWSNHQHLAIPLSKMLSDADGICVDQLLKVENLQEDWAKLAQNLGIELPALPVLNVGEKARPDDVATLSETTKALIQTHYQGDFTDFQYSP